MNEISFYTLHIYIWVLVYIHKTIYLFAWLIANLIAPKPTSNLLTVYLMSICSRTMFKEAATL